MHQPHEPQRPNLGISLAVLLFGIACAVAAQPVPGWTFTPPPCQGGVFNDVNCSGQFDAWIEQYAHDGITGGCGGGNYCPTSPVTRGQMAVFVEKAMRGASGWPPNTVLVHQVLAADGSTDTVASGQALRDAIASIPSSGPGAPSAVSPWLVKIGPGTFDLGSTPLALRDWLTLEGSGASNDFGDPALTSIVSLGTAAETGTLIASPVRCEIRNLEVVNGGGAANAIAVSIPGTPTVTLRRIALRASAGSALTAGLHATGGSIVRLEDAFVAASTDAGFVAGVLSTGGASLTIARTVSFTGGAGAPRFGISATDGTLSVVQSQVNLFEAAVNSTGIAFDGTSGDVTRSGVFVGCSGAASAVGVSLGNGVAVDIRESVVVAQGTTGCPATGVQNQGSTFRVFGGELQSTRYAIANSGAPPAVIVVHHAALRGDVNVISNGANFTTQIGASQLNGPVLSPTGLTCVASYDGNFNAVGTNCQ